MCVRERDTLLQKRGWRGGPEVDATLGDLEAVPKNQFIGEKCTFSGSVNKVVKKL